jgi:serine/threonine protein kinase/tetratricopeptide (TPR) repeat protein
VSVPPARWARVKGVFDGTLALAPAERATYVIQACGDDGELRRQVEALLASHEQAQAFLETPAIAVLDMSAPIDDLVGRTIGIYRICARVGAGGMGEVYRAEDTKLDRPVALKLLPKAVASDADRLRRFHTEARAASALNHPNILVIHDFGDLDGRPFIVTEFVEGVTLRQRLDAGRLTLHEAIEIGSQVAGALAAAHARGIVHRDVKPDNVMIRPDGYVKVLDFGLAKLPTTDEPVAVGVGAHTTPGMVMGTPRYMSPEQARGAAADPRSDVWSFGVMLYELIAGCPPFVGATPADLIGAILHTEPVPLELQAPRTPPQLGRIVARSLRKSRLERYASASELVLDLAAVRTEADDADLRPVERSNELIANAAPPSTPKEQLKKRTRLVVIPFRLLRPDADIDFLAFSLADAIATTLSTLDSLVVRSSMAAAKYSVEPLDLKALAIDAEVDMVLAGTLLRAGSTLRLGAQLLTTPHGTIVWSERIDVPLDDVVRIQDELIERIVDSLAVPLTASDQQNLRRDVPASARAYELYLRGTSHSYDPQQWALARDLFIECVAQDPGYAPAWARLGRCYRLSAKFLSSTVDEVRDNLQRADVAFRKAFELNADLPLAHNLYTALETDLGHAEAAMLRLVTRARQRRADPELFAGLVHACRYCGLLDESVAAHARARELDPQVPTSVAQTYWMRGDYEHAIEGFTTGFFSGLPLISLGRDAEALALARASASRVRDPTTRLYQSLVTLMLEGRSNECLRLLADLAPRNPDPESVYFGARMFARLGAPEAALEQLDRAVDMGFCCPAAFERDPWLDSVRSEKRFIGALARAQFRHAEARRKFREAGGARRLGLA